MNVKLLHSTPLWVCSRAIRKCWASEDKSDSYEQRDGFGGTYIECGTKDKELIERVGNKNKHKSTLEHLVYTFDIDGISRACLQELARHRIASYSVKSTRYTLKELSKEEYIYSVDNKGCEVVNIKAVERFCVTTDDISANYYIAKSLQYLQNILLEGASNDIAKYCLPEAYKTSLVMTINARSLQNFIELRISKSALKEIRELAYELFRQLPEEHKYLYEETLKK